MDIDRILQSAVDRDWTDLAAEVQMSSTRLAQLALAAIDSPAVIAQHPTRCRVLADRRDQARMERSGRH